MALGIGIWWTLDLQIPSVSSSVCLARHVFSSGKQQAVCMSTWPGTLSDSDPTWFKELVNLYYVDAGVLMVDRMQIHAGRLGKSLRVQRQCCNSDIFSIYLSYIFSKVALTTIYITSGVILFCVGVFALTHYLSLLDLTQMLLCFMQNMHNQIRLWDILHHSTHPSICLLWNISIFMLYQ